MRRKAWIIILFLLLFFIGIIAWWKLFTNKGEVLLKLAPDLKLVAIKITDIDKERVYATVKTYLSNSLPLHITTKKLNYRLYADSVLLFKKTLDKAIEINSGDSTLVELPVTILTPELIKMLKYFTRTGKDSAEYILRLDLTVNMPGGKTRDFDYEKRMILPTFQIPDVKLKHFKLEKPLFKRLQLVLTIYNPNKYPLKLSGGRYHFKIGSELDVEGGLDKPLDLEAKDTSDAVMEIDIEKAKVPKLIWETLFKKKETQFSFYFDCKLKAKSEFLDGSKVKLKVEGNLKEAMEAIETVKETK